MNAFLRRFLMHYGIYRRYPLGWLPALRMAHRAPLKPQNPDSPGDDPAREGRWE
jgi:hypothetical protein